MTRPDIIFTLLILVASACLVVFAISMWMRGGGISLGPRVAGAPTMQRAPVRSLRGIVWALIPIGAVLFGIGLKHAVEERRTMKWKTVTGDLLEARVEEVTETRYDMLRRRLPVRRYLPVVKYSYREGEKKFKGERLSLREGSVSSKKWAEFSLRGLKPGEKVPVYIDPNDPRESVLKKSLLPETIILLSVGGTLCLLAIILI